MSDAAPPRWDLQVRARRTPMVAVVAAVIVFGAHVAIGALLRIEATGVYFRVADQVAMMLLGAVFAGLLLLLTRPRLRVGREGLAVRTLVSDKIIGWDQVVDVSFPLGARWARVDLPDDEYVPVLAVQVVDRERAVAAMDRTRELMARYRPTAPASPPSSPPPPLRPGPPAPRAPR